MRIALRPEDKNILHVGRNCYENLFRDIFADANIILFIPNINSVHVFINGKEERTCFRDSEKWVVSDYEEVIPFDLQEKINKTIDKGNSRIPENIRISISQRCLLLVSTMELLLSLLMMQLCIAICQRTLRGDCHSS